MKSGIAKAMRFRHSDWPDSALEAYCKTVMMSAPCPKEQEAGFAATRETHNSVAVRQIAEHSEINTVHAREDQDQSDDRSHPVPAALAEREDERAGREDEAADERGVQPRFRAALGNMFAVKALLVEVGAEPDD